MKKIILFLTALTLIFYTQAQNLSAADSALLRQIFASNRSHRSLQANIKHDLIKSGKTQHRYGTLYCQRVKNAKPDDVPVLIAMHYTDPKGESYIINSTHLYNGIDGHDLKFSYKIVPRMKLLGCSVSLGFNGDVLSILSKMKLDISITSDAKSNIITLTGGKKGITKMVMKYNKSNGLINYMEIHEALGITHRYSMGTDAKGASIQPQINVPIDAKVFDIK